MNVQTTEWLDAIAPCTPSSAYTARLHRRLVPLLAEQHDIQLGVASMLIRPMLHDLVRAGLWQQRTTRHHETQYRLTDGTGCHQFYWLDSAVTHYDASHSDCACPHEAGPVPRGRTWLPHIFDAVPPPEGASNPWRPVLRTAACLSVTLIKPAIAYYGRHALNLSRLTPSNFATVFFSMAAEAEAVHDKWTGLPGSHFLTDNAGLIWQLTSATNGSSKPAITGVLPPGGNPIDQPHLQRARRSPEATTTTSGRPTT